MNDDKFNFSCGMNRLTLVRLSPNLNESHANRRISAGNGTQNTNLFKTENGPIATVMIFITNETATFLFF